MFCVPAASSLHCLADCLVIHVGLRLASRTHEGEEGKPSYYPHCLLLRWAIHLAALQLVNVIFEQHDPIALLHLSLTILLSQHADEAFPPCFLRLNVFSSIRKEKESARQWGWWSGRAAILKSIGSMFVCYHSIRIKWPLWLSWESMHKGLHRGGEIAAKFESVLSESSESVCCNCRQIKLSTVSAGERIYACVTYLHVCSYVGFIPHRKIIWKLAAGDESHNMTTWHPKAPCWCGVGKSITTTISSILFALLTDSKCSHMNKSKSLSGGSKIKNI